MNTENDWLEKALHQNESYIEDDGFTEKLMRHLPVARSGKTWLRPLVLFSATVLSTTMAVYSLPADSIFLYDQLLGLWSQPLAVTLGILSVVSISLSALAWLIGDVEL
jgi:hypothetical protein